MDSSSVKNLRLIGIGLPGARSICADYRIKSVLHKVLDEKELTLKKTPD
jgi:hypothetical protein